MKKIKLTKKDLEIFLQQKLPKYKIEVISVEKVKKKTKIHTIET